MKNKVEKKGVIEMNLQEIRAILRKVDTHKTLYFTRKFKTHYMSFSPEVEGEVLDILMDHVNKYLEPFLELEQIDFNPTGYRDGTIEICEVDYLGNFDEVINSFDGGNIEGIEDEADNFSFYCIDIDDEDGNVKLFRRVTKFKRLYSKGILAAFQGNRLNKIDDKMLGLDGDVDLVVFNGEVAVLSHTSLERIFRLEEQFFVKANAAIDLIRTTGKIVNFDEFEEDCMNDLRIQKVLTKMLREEGELNRCFDNFENIVQTINIFGLDIEIQRAPVEQIIYEDKRQIMDILRLARDSYYLSLVREKPGIDNKI